MVTFLVHHDYPVHADGIRLAVTSIRCHCPDAPLLVSAPGADAALEAWLRDRGCLALRAHTEGLTWNVKPGLLLRALDEGHDPVLWVDSDIVLSGDPRGRLPADPAVFVATEEPARYPHQGTRVRREAWGLPAGRDLPVTVNTSVVRASVHHLVLLREWQALLNRDDYAAAQRRPWNERPFHLLGDQDALSALLGSAAQRQTEIRQLRRGIDIAHCAGPDGFPLGARLRATRDGMPPFVHSMGQKPWECGVAWRHAGGRGPHLRAAYQDLHLRLSPYSILAREFAGDARVSTAAFAPASAWERALLRLGRRSPALPEIPVTAIDESLRGARQIYRALRRRRGKRRAPPPHPRRPPR